jgi:hypothetical protein
MLRVNPAEPAHHALGSFAFGLDVGRRRKEHPEDAPARRREGA